MIHFRPLLLTSVCLLTACSTSMTPANLETVAEFKSAPDKGLLVMDLTGDAFCSSAKLTLTGSDKRTITLPIQAKKNGSPAVKTVAPGTYKLIYGSCSHVGQYTGPLPDLPIWFGDITVEAGQATYAGTIVMQRDELKTRREGADAVIGFLNMDTNKEVSFVTYDIENRLEEVIERLGPELSSLSDQLSYNPPLVFLDKTEFQAAIQRAYAPTADGKNPSKSEVEEKIGKEISAALLESFKTIKERNPDYKGNFNSAKSQSGI